VIVLPLLALAFSGLLPLSTPDSEVRAEPTADQLFQEGLTLLKSGKTGEACSRLAQSYATEPALGALAVLAMCHRVQGRLKTAHDEFLLVEKRSRGKGFKQRAEVAKEQAAELESQIPRIVVRLSSPPEGVAVFVANQKKKFKNGTATFLVDPGNYEVRVSAKGYQSRRALVSVENHQEHFEVQLAPLERPAVSVAQAPNEQHSRFRDPWIWGLGLTGGGFLAAGGTFGVLALRSNKASKNNCVDDLCNPEGVEQRSRALSQAKASSALIGIGAAAIAGATVVYLVQGKERSLEAHAFTHGPLSVSVKGTF